MIPPYFHDGSAATLPQAVRIMAQVQFGIKLSNQEEESIAAIPQSLTGTLHSDFVAASVLPPGAFHPVQQ